jgi:hypothetical protein
MSCSCTLVFHARPATIFLGDGAFQVLLSLAVLMGQRNTRSARLLAGVLMSRPRSVGRMVTFALRKRSTCSAWRNVVKLNSLEEGRRITGGTFYPTTAFMEFRLGRQHPKTVLLPAYGNFGICKMDLTLWALQNPTHHRAFSASSFGSGA